MKNTLENLRAIEEKLKEKLERSQYVGAVV